MKHDLHGTSIHIATGGRDFDPTGKVVVLIHGSGQNHLTWILQARYLAYHGFNVLAPDMPGHGLSGGKPLTSIEEMAQWTIDLLDDLSVETASLVGHSQGVLVALEAAAKFPDRISSLGLIAGAMAIPVNDKLVDMSENALNNAIKLMTDWGHGPQAHMYDNTLPGHSFLGYGRKVMDMNEKTALLADLKACNAYENGEATAATISQPTLCILAGKDRMTPAKAGRAMAAAIKDAAVEIIADAGHFLPAEAPFEVNRSLTRFLQ